MYAHADAAEKADRKLSNQLALQKNARTNAMNGVHLNNSTVHAQEFKNEVQIGHRHIDQSDNRQHIENQHVENHYHIEAVDGIRDVARVLGSSSSSVDSYQHLDVIMKSAGMILQELSGVYSDHLNVQDIVFAAQKRHTQLARQTSLLLFHLYQFSSAISNDLPRVSALLKDGQINSAIDLCQDLLAFSSDLEASLQQFVTDFGLIPDLLFQAYGKASRSVSALHHRVENAKMFTSIFASIGGTVAVVGGLSVPISKGESWRFFMNECSFGAKCGMVMATSLPFAASLWSHRAGLKFEKMIEGFEEKMKEIMELHKELDMQTRLLSIMNMNLKMAIDSQKRMCSFAKMSKTIVVDGGDNERTWRGYQCAIDALDEHVENAVNVWTKIEGSLKMRDLTSAKEMASIIDKQKQRKKALRSSQDESDTATDSSSAVESSVVLSSAVVKSSEAENPLEDDWYDFMTTPFSDDYN